ncbi:J domain-containing protein [Halomarina litorea]|uniref:J domain-containing protein n=1 Tax=Halomarina litorea TaxID=2961595 RepID=UPI0020C37753|nr:J domain-containing protein [Halomarina sp. BCD28]
MNTVAQAVLPNWLFLGILIGIGLSVFVAGAFVVGRRAFPDPPSTGPRRSGETRRRAEIRQYLRAIDEPFAEDHVVAGETVEFYLPRRDVAITFDPRVFYAIERGSAYTYPVLVEHEMPGMFLGSRLPFETPDLGFGDGERDDEVDRDRAAFAVLGLPASASENEVRAAYRAKVKAVHPDQGGDPDEFRQLQEAYATAREQVAG